MLDRPFASLVCYCYVCRSHLPTKSLASAGRLTWPIVEHWRNSWNTMTFKEAEAMLKREKLLKPKSSARRSRPIVRT